MGGGEGVGVGAGEEARLECLVSGFPTPTITWARVDRKVFHTGAATMDGPTMLVTSAHSTDRGKYRWGLTTKYLDTES